VVRQDERLRNDVSVIAFDKNRRKRGNLNGFPLAAQSSAMREGDASASQHWTMVDVAQLVEPRIVIPAVVGSSPIVHPRLMRWIGLPATTIAH
jgi:hypothetical protein